MYKNNSRFGGTSKVCIPFVKSSSSIVFCSQSATILILNVMWH